MGKAIKIPESMQQLFAEISTLTDNYCKTSLNQEYADLCKIAIATLCRKKPSLLVFGSSKVWACSIVYALGQANFLFDKSQTPHTNPSEICGWFGISKSTVGNKAKLIRDMLKISYYNHKWNVDVRDMPLEVQYQTYEKGLILYVPSLQSHVIK